MSDTRVHKYLVPVNNQGMEMRKGAEVLNVGVQNDNVVTWVKEDMSQPVELRRLYGIFTGGSVKQSDAYHGTVQFDNGIVVHVFEEEYIT